MKRLLIVAAAALAFAGGLLAGRLLGPDTPALEAGTLLEPPRAVADFSLEATTAGGTLDRAELAGRWTLLFFGFTRCPDICPNTLQRLAQARERAGLSGAAAPRIVLVTVDPEFDTVERLTPYVSHFGEDIVGLTGAPEAIASLAQDVGIVYQRVPVDGDDYTMDHSAVVLLLDADAALRAVFSPPLRTEAIASDLAVLLGSAS